MMAMIVRDRNLSGVENAFSLTRDAGAIQLVAARPFRRPRGGGGARESQHRRHSRSAAHPVSSRRCASIGWRSDEACTPVKFWDASAIIPLLAEEPAREAMLRVLEEDAEILAWWGTPVEIAAAIARRERENALTAKEVEATLAVARHLADSWHEIVPSTALRRTAERLLRVHPVRAADSLQLAAAARREGFAVVDG